MRSELKPGLEHRFGFTVPESKLVPALYPESAEFQAMPKVLATGYFVGLLEWACIQAIKPFLDWPAEQSVGTHVDVSHCAATPAGLTVSVTVVLREVDGRRLLFDVEAHDGIELIGKGRHERFVIDHARFAQKARRKAEAIATA
jgi:fluoroacetyl-CoA thioesterase